MHHKIKFSDGGGLYSHIMILLRNIQHWQNKNIINENDSIFIDSTYKTNTKLKNVKFNIFDTLFEQQNFKIENILTTSMIHVSEYENFTSNLQSYRKITKNFLKINKNISKKVNSYVNDNFSKNKTLGVHVRMTDMHIYHPWMGIVTHEKYYEYIDNVINKNKIEKIYIASDNFESIHLMKERYGDLIINYDTIYRSESCDSNPHNLRLHKWNINKSFFVDSFVDSLLLSNCDILIGRNSLYSWGSHIFSKDCQKYYNIK